MTSSWQQVPQIVPETTTWQPAPAQIVRSQTPIRGSATPPHSPAPASRSVQMQAVSPVQVQQVPITASLLNATTPVVAAPTTTVVMDAQISPALRHYIDCQVEQRSEQAFRQLAAGELNN